ncbi:MAG: response regulator [Nannocystaceae bacterium]|nr:response regulator [Nannocystaceae bacterium]
MPSRGDPVSSEGWDVALGAAVRALGLGMWRLDFARQVASWDATAAELLQREGPESTQAFTQWLTAGLGGESLPQWSEDEEWVSPPVRFRGPQSPRYIRFAGRRKGLVWEGSMHDITREWMLHNRVAEAERLEVIGRFSAGVAHNFNNMLTIIDACLADAQTRLTKQAQPDPEVIRDIQDAQDAAARAGLVAENLNRLAHPDNEPPETCAVQALCTSALEDLRRVAVENLEIVHSIPQNLWVRQAPGVLEEVLNNLLINANHAVAGREHPKIWVRGTRSDSFSVPSLELVVSDNGCGVAPDVEPYLFQPFVTSKGKAGTGLGLATSAESLRRMGGQLAYREREGGGAEFVIMLPLAPAPPGRNPPRQKSEPVEADLAGRQVLIVDDEPIIRRLVKRILERAGATTTAAGDLASARRALADAPDAVLLDRTLGPERGIDLLPDVRAISPAAQVIFFSGEPVGPEESALVDGVVPKPVGAAALISAISEVLSRVGGEHPDG